IRLLALSIVAVVNGLVLAAMAFLVLVGWRGAVGDTNPDLPLWLPIGAAVVVIGLGVLSASPWGEWFFRLFYPIRPLTKREAAKLVPAMERVQAAYEAQHRRSLKANLFMIDDPMPQAMALGFGTIAVTRGALEIATDNELAGVLAHESGHLHHRDSMVTSALNSISLVQAVVAEVSKVGFIAFLLLGVVLMIYSTDLSWVLGLTIMVPIVLGVGRLLNHVVNGLVVFVLGLTDRSVEYRADRFAGDLGLGPGLAGFLERLAGMEAMTAHGFLVMYMQSHPPTALRIDRLEAMQEVKAAA
ncbi:MAG: M48 family metalloprotease, partial [Alphaproteobacteria bacterium]|nr:M48 family metalloprotease [Alphaproteobacteria bacterium]